MKHERELHGREKGVAWMRADGLTFGTAGKSFFVSQAGTAFGQRALAPTPWLVYAILRDAVEPFNAAFADEPVWTLCGP